MPYIQQAQRNELDPKINELSKSIHAGYDKAYEVPGLLNYSITRLILDTLQLKSYPKYWKIVVAMGTLVTVMFELYRRIVAPYEDKKAEENGDVY